MFVYEVAIEVGKHSTEVVEAARELGMGEVGPATELDAEQVARLRARLAPAGAPGPAGPSGAPGPAGPMTWGAAPAPPPPSASAGEPAGRWQGRAPIAVVVVVALLAAGAIAYLGVSAGPDRERERELATADPLDGVTTTTDPDAMRGHAAFCAAGAEVVSFERTLVEAIGAQDMVLLTESAKLRHRWKEQVDVMRMTARPSLDDDLATYVAINEQMLDVIVAQPAPDRFVAEIEAIDTQRGADAFDVMYEDYDAHC